MRISDCSSDVCSSDLAVERFTNIAKASLGRGQRLETIADPRPEIRSALDRAGRFLGLAARSEEPTSELQSLMRISYAVFCFINKIHLMSRAIYTRSTPTHTITIVRVTSNSLSLPNNN